MKFFQHLLIRSQQLFNGLLPAQFRPDPLEPHSADPLAGRGIVEQITDRLSELPRLLEPWRDTVDEVVLVPVSADEEGPVRELADAAIAAF